MIFNNIYKINLYLSFFKKIILEDVEIKLNNIR